MTPTPDKPAGEALKACPHCGSADIDPEGWASTDSKGPACNDCGASAGCISQSLADNIGAWNTRTDPPSALDDEVVAVVDDLVERLRREASLSRGHGDFVMTRHAYLLAEAADRIQSLIADKRDLAAIDAALSHKD